DARLEHDLEQHVAELVAHTIGHAACDRVGKLVSLLERVRRDRRPGLLTVPRATRSRIAQARHDRDQAFNLRHRVSCNTCRRVSSMPAVAPQMFLSRYGMS